MTSHTHTTPDGHAGGSGPIAPRRVVVVGGVAGGMFAATRLRRLDERAEIVVVERSGHVSYANCGLPYCVGGVIEDEDDLLLQPPESLFERFRLDVRVGSEVVDVDPDRHVVTVRSTTDGTEYDLPFDKLVLSPGAVPVRRPIPGFDTVKVLRTVEDAEHLFGAVSARPSSAVVIGAGFIGLETAENLLFGDCGPVEPDDLRAELAALGTGPFVVCCQVGQRGHTATSLLHDMGVTARNMDGGYLSWKAQQAADAGDPGLLRSDTDVHEDE